MSGGMPTTKAWEAKETKTQFESSERGFARGVMRRGPAERESTMSGTWEMVLAGRQTVQASWRREEINISRMFAEELQYAHVWGSWSIIKWQVRVWVFDETALC